LSHPNVCMVHEVGDTAAGATIPRHGVRRGHLAAGAPRGRAGDRHTYPVRRRRSHRVTGGGRAGRGTRRRISTAT
jgi:hypothetical protein